MTLCGATTKQGGWACKLPPAPGGTRCRFHGGASPRAKAAAQRRLDHNQAVQAVRTYGLPLDIAPEDALLEEVHRTAGHVAWLHTLIGEGDKDRLTQWVTVSSENGEGSYQKRSVWVELYQQERGHLTTVCKAAIAAGLDARRVQLAERQGELVAELVQVAVKAMDASPDQQTRAFEAVRGHLALARPA